MQKSFGALCWTTPHGAALVSSMLLHVGQLQQLITLTLFLLFLRKAVQKGFQASQIQGPCASSHSNTYLFCLP